MIMCTQEKKLKNWYIQEYTTETTFEQFLNKNDRKKSDDDNGEFQQQVPQRLVDEYEHMNSRNERYDPCFKHIEA